MFAVNLSQSELIETILGAEPIPKAQLEERIEEELRTMAPTYLTIEDVDEDPKCPLRLWSYIMEQHTTS